MIRANGKSSRSTTELLENLRLLEESNFTLIAKNPEEQPKLLAFLGDIRNLLLELTEV